MRNSIAFRRASLPYGVWKTAGGREVAFNRRYKPIYSRVDGGPAEAADPAEWVTGILQTTWLYDDATPEAAKQSAGLLLMAEWGVP